MVTDIKHEATLATRRARDKKARDRLDESYIRKLIRKRFPDVGPDDPIPPGYITIRRLILSIRRKVWGRSTPEMEAAFDADSKEHKRNMSAKARRKT
jgi:hypothetical protein